MKPRVDLRLNASSWLLAGVAALALSGCDRGGVFKTPLVRVDLADKLPPKVRKLAIAGITLECKKKLRLADGDVAPTFVIAWRVLDFKHSRYVIAVEVVPQGDGRLAGVSRLAGSGWVGQPRNLAKKNELALGAVPVRVGWSAQRGCRQLGGSKQIELRADDPSCKPPKTPKLLRPVD